MVVRVLDACRSRRLQDPGVKRFERHSHQRSRMNLTGKVVVITGGKRIGRVVAQEAAARGADLVLSYRGSKQEAEDTVRDVSDRGRNAIAVPADVSRAADCAALMSAAHERFGRIDALVNMASVYGSTPFDELTEAGWDRDININLKSAFLCAKAAIPA